MKIGVTSVDVTGHDDGTAFCCDGNKTKESEHCDASQSETAEYTSTFGGIFLRFYSFYRQHCSQTFYAVYLNRLFP